MATPHILWILNGCGMESGSITGGPVRFHEISRRLQGTGAWAQTLQTTTGGAAMLRRMGCTLPTRRTRAALVAKRELFRVSRLWSYLLSTLDTFRALQGVPQPDVVITVSDYFCDIVPALAIKRRYPGCRWIAWVHHRERPPRERPGNRLVNELTLRMQDWSFRRIAAHADGVWMYDTDAGDQVRARLGELGMPAARMRFMLCGIDTAAIQQAPTPAKTVDAVMIGVRPNKGLHDIIPVWEEVLRLRPGTTLRLMGGMSGEQAALEEMRRRGLDRVIEVFRSPGGFLAPADYYAKIKEARVLFAPSHEEGWGIMVCEAMACGLPAVTYDLPVYRRIYGDALRDVPCFDTRAFAAALVEMLDSSARFESYVHVGRVCASRYAWDTLALADDAALRAALCKGAGS
jgi:glycosyltransferase involved in cell wall biosynthesis